MTLDVDCSGRLVDLHSHATIREWIELSWADCAECGGSLVGPGDDDEKVFDGEPLACPECGLQHTMFVDHDEDGWSVLANTNDAGSWVYLRNTALAGLRRLLSIKPHWVTREWEVSP